MSENRMVASSSSRSDSADGEAWTSSATSGGRKDASALANSARSFMRWNRSPSPVWVARSAMSFSLAGVSGSAGETVTVSAPSSSCSCPTGNDRLLGSVAARASSVPRPSSAMGSGNGPAWGQRACGCRTSPSRSHTVAFNAPVASTTRRAIRCSESSVEAPATPRENAERTS
jgi:hypothetical protein